jgi:class 3 adenylate cyclase
VADVPVSQPRQRVIGLEPGQPSYRILIVEDRLENRRLLVKMLEPLGFAVREAVNGQEGAAIWEAWDPHLVWMDMRMPVMDEYEATKRMKSTTKGQAEEVYTVLCCDIRNFTAISESVDCTECYRFLNSFFAVMEPSIRSCGGFIYQYVGDEVVALFKPQEAGSTDNAVQAAVAIQGWVLVEYNRQREAVGKQPIQVGIGINTGPVAIGIAGTPERMDACAFGSTVNLASRCQALTKDFGRRIIITEETYRHLSNTSAFHIRSLGRSAIRGLEEKVPLYAVLEAEEANVGPDDTLTKQERY